MPISTHRFCGRAKKFLLPHSVAYCIYEAEGIKNGSVVWVRRNRWSHMQLVSSQSDRNEVLYAMPKILGVSLYTHKRFFVRGYRRMATTPQRSRRRFLQRILLSRMTSISGTRYSAYAKQSYEEQMPCGTIIIGKPGKLW